MNIKDLDIVKKLATGSGFYQGNANSKPIEEKNIEVAKGLIEGMLKAYEYNKTKQN
jgi:hypothetical protein